MYLISVARRYVCPDYGYDARRCPLCDGPKVRCYTHYGLAYR